MYQKENVPCYQYNNPSSEQLKKVLAPEHTALLLIDMQNDFISSKGKFSLGGRDSSAIRAIVPTARRFWMPHGPPMCSLSTFSKQRSHTGKATAAVGSHLKAATAKPPTMRFPVHGDGSMWKILNHIRIFLKAFMNQ